MSLHMISWFELSTHAPEKNPKEWVGEFRKKYFFRESGVGKSDNITNFRFGQILVGGDCCGALGRCSPYRMPQDS